MIHQINTSRSETLIYGTDSESRLAIDRSICILTRPVVDTGFNRSLLVDWWSIGQLKKIWSM